MAGTAHRVISAILRVFEFGMSAVNLGILARFFSLIHEVGAHEDPRWTYALAMAAISLSLAVILMPPMKYSFYLFPIDFAMFVMWIVSFALLEDLAGTRTCNSHWYDEHWIIFWGNIAVLGGSACARLRVIIAFSFILAMFWFFSGLLGIYASVEYHHLGAKTTNAIRKIPFLNRKKNVEDDFEMNGAGTTSETQKLHKEGAPAPDSNPHV